MKTQLWTVTLLLAAGAGWSASGQTTVDLSRQGRLAAGATLPARCAVGQMFFKTNAPPGANLYVCAAADSWAPMGLPATGAALPPGTCSPGSLYLLNDPAHALQQLYVCSASNTWSMSSFQSGLSTARPANCVAGQIWLSTDTGSMTYCSTTGSPGVWNGAGSGIGGDGLSYLNNILGLNGAFNLVSSANKIGIRAKLIDPDSRGSDNERAGIFEDIRFSGLQGPGNYANSLGSYRAVNIYNGRNAPDNNDKKTQVGDALNVFFGGGGQKFGRTSSVLCAGSGDCGGADFTIKSGGHNTAWGDEASIGVSARIFQVESELVTPIVTATRTACNTTTTQPIAKSNSSTEHRTIAVASTAGCSVNDWVTVEQGVFGATDTRVEVVKLTAVGAGTITALFQQDHVAGVSVSPSNVLVLADMESFHLFPNRLGQDRIAIVADGVHYNTGSIASIVQGEGSAGGLFTVTGQDGANWSVGMVGGNSNLIGCVSFDADTFARDVYSTHPLRSWFPIVAASGNTMTVFKYTGSAKNGTYDIRPCAPIGGVDVDTSASDMTVTAAILQNNSFAWDAGKTFDQTIDPWGYVQHGIMSFCAWYGPGNCGIAFRAANAGYRPGMAAFEADSGLLNNDSTWGYTYGMWLRANTQQAAIEINGRSFAGLALNLSTSPQDLKKLHWEGLPNGVADIYPDGGGFVIDSALVRKLKLKGSAFGNQALTLDYTGVTGDQTISFPNASGSLVVYPGGTFPRTLPAAIGDAVDVGEFLVTGFSGSSYEILVEFGGVMKKFAFVAEGFATGGPWPGGRFNEVTPVSESGDTSNTNFALDVKAYTDGVEYARFAFRVRHTAVAGAQAGKVTIRETGHHNSVSFVESTAVTSPGDPGVILPSTRPVLASCTLAALPASPITGQVCYFTDAASSTDCTSGGGTAKSFCIFNGSTWAKP